MSISRHVSDSIQSNKQQAHPDNMSNLHKQLLKPFSVNLGPFREALARLFSNSVLLLSCLLRLWRPGDPWPPTLERLGARRPVTRV